jgi:hypothetical protein
VGGAVASPNRTAHSPETGDRLRPFNEIGIYNVHLHEDNEIYALCCDICGVNSARNSEYASFNADTLRGHINKSHSEFPSQAETVEQCKGPPIGEADRARILQGKRTAFDHRVFRCTVRGKRGKAREVDDIEGNAAMTPCSTNAH